MRFVKITISPYNNSSRNIRDLSVVTSLNKDNIVIARGDTNRIIPKEGYTVHERSTKPLGKSAYLLYLNRILSILLWARYVRRLKPDWISCHGLIALGIGWLSTLFLRNKPRLIYDSQEFELGVCNVIKPRGFLQTQFVRITESFLIHKSVLTVVVSDSIANELQRIHSLKRRPIVIRNIPFYWNINEGTCKLTRRNIMKNFANSNPDDFLVMYHGAVMQGRGIEIMIKALCLTENINLVILGYGSRDYIDELKRLCQREKVQHRVVFFPAVPLELLWLYIEAVDVGMITIPYTGQNHYFMLPNKLFENIQALTPVISSNFPDISKVIDTYRIGLTVDPSNTTEIAEAMRRLRDDTKLYQSYKNNLIKAKEELCWEKESKKLKSVYRKLFQSIDNTDG